MLIQKIRLQRGWSQEQLAEISGLSVRTVQRIERGQSASLESMKALAAVFEVDLNELMPVKEAEMPAVVATTAPEAEEALAFAKVRRIKRFSIHIMQYGLVILMLAIINLVTSPGYLWFLWPALGWGIGLALHALRTFDLVPFFGARWEKEQVERHLGRKL